MSKRVRSRVGIFTAALVGALVASHVFARRANAGANCSPPRWTLTLLSVKSLNGTSNHEAYWPTDALLAATPSQVRVWTMRSILGQVGTIEAQP